MSACPHVYFAITSVTLALSRSGISKSRNNAQQGYAFRGIDEVYNALSSVLAENKLCILPRVLARTTSERPTKNGGVSSYVVLDVEFDFVSAVDGSKHTIRTAGEAMDTADKATNKAMSAAMKYACLMAFQIPTAGDNDADAHTPEPVMRKAPGPVSAAAGSDVDKIVSGLIEAIEAAKDTKALMGVFTKAKADPTLPDAAREYVVQLLSVKRRQLEGKTAA